MIFPDEIKDQLFSANNSTDQQRALTDKKKDPLLRLEMMLTDDEILSDNLASWKVRSLSSTEMIIDLEFKKLIDVS